MIVWPSDKIVVWFSCGAASAVAAKITIDLYGKENVRVVNSPVIDEDWDNYRFLNDVEKWLGVKVERALNPKYPLPSAVNVWANRKFMSGPRGAPCTIELKKEARYEWERQNKVNWHVLGFTVDEQKRYKRFILTERSNVLPILINANLTKDDCFRTINDAGIALPRVYSMGYPNANCIGCVKASSPTYWNHVRKQHPHTFAARAIQSRTLGAKLVRYKSDRIFLDELPEDAVGQPMKTMSIECGIFCEERNED